MLGFGMVAKSERAASPPHMGASVAMKSNAGILPPEALMEGVNVRGVFGRQL